jgi:hypothetical protein
LDAFSGEFHDPRDDGLDEHTRPSKAHAPDVRKVRQSTEDDTREIPLHERANA